MSEPRRPSQVGRRHVVAVIGGLAGTAAIAACVGDDPLTDIGAPDAAGEATSPADASAEPDRSATGDAGAICNVDKPFGGARLLGSFNTALSEGEFSLSGQGLTAYFARRIDGGANYTFSAERADVDAAFGPATLLDAINGDAGAAIGSVTADEAEIYFTPTAGDIFVANRASKSSPFLPPKPVFGAPDGRGHPFIRADGQALYFSRNVVSLHRVVRNGQVFGAESRLTELDSDGGFIARPVVTPDDLTIYWTSTRQDGAAKGGYDIWIARRASTTTPFGVPMNVAELNTIVDEFPNYVTADGCTLYFTSVRPDGPGDRDIFVATRGR